MSIYTQRDETISKIMSEGMARLKNPRPHFNPTHGGMGGGVSANAIPGRGGAPMPSPLKITKSAPKKIHIPRPA